ncbi:MAG: hypothetical protein R2909_10175 [Gemmatimonadales bacterium]
MVLDRVDAQAHRLNPSLLTDVFTHELGHALGFGVLSFKHLLGQATSSELASRGSWPAAHSRRSQRPASSSAALGPDRQQRNSGTTLVHWNEA